MIGRWRRWAYFERRDDRWQAMVPYRSLRLLENLTDTQNGTARARAISELTDLVLESITLAEGLRDPQVRKRYLALRVSRVKQGGLRSYRLFPRERLRVEVAPVGDLARYLEYSPDAVELIATEQTATARLRIPLDLLEMLELIAYELREYEVDPDDLTAETVAAKTWLPLEQAFKTLVARGDRQGVCFDVVPGNANLDLKALAKLTVDRKVKTVPLKDVQPLTGYVRGGVTVLGAKKAYPVYVDETIELFDVVSV